MQQRWCCACGPQLASYRAGWRAAGRSAASHAVPLGCDAHDGITCHCSVCMPLCPRPHSPQIKDLVELVQKARMSKILQGLATLGGAITVKLNNLAAMEINAGGWVGCGGRVLGAVAERNAVGCRARFAEGNAGEGHLHGSVNASVIAVAAGCRQCSPASWPPQTLPDPWPAALLLPLPLLQCALSSLAHWTCSSSCRCAPGLVVRVCRGFTSQAEGGPHACLTAWCSWPRCSQ